MSSYDEHLISMAGGDGEPEPLDLDEFIALARTDVPALLALVREQQARIGRGAELLDELMGGYNDYGVKYADLEPIRAALGPKP